MTSQQIKTGCVIGSGPNGLAAAIVLAQAGVKVDVFEAQPTPGGAARTMELTLPGFLHDFGSAVHPLAAGSPFFSSLPLENHGLRWIHSPAVLAHPLDDGTAVLLERDLQNARNSFGPDGESWFSLMGPFVEHWDEFAAVVLSPPSTLPGHPFLMGRFGLHAFRPATSVARRFQTQRVRALFAGLAAHSFLALDEPLSGAFGMLMAISAHAVGWPIPTKGAQSLTDALVEHLTTFGGSVRTSSPVESLDAVPDYDLYLCDVTPKQLLKIAGHRFTRSYSRLLQRFRYGPGVFKVDYALSEPIPWRARDCLQAATVHIGGTLAEIAASESAIRNRQVCERPFVLLAQPSLFDATRAPSGKHTAWAYCHVPNESAVNMLPKIESQIERFAPEFRECVLARRTFSPRDLESMDANLVGGDVGGGTMNIGNFLFRPTWRHYATSARDIFICSASTPPGGGVHGMCGYHAARTGLKKTHVHR